MYILTPEGLHLLQALAPLNEWALRWAEGERSQQDQT
jgi:DNA-binding HxlR family transcriptional regulator